MDILAKLDAFDGKHTGSLETIAAQLSPTEPLIDELCELAQLVDTRLQTATTWLLKRFQEDGFVFDQAQAVNLLALLGQAGHWEAKLHLLQILPGLVIPREQKESLKRLLDENLSGDNKFVRAWSYNGLFVLAEQFPELRAELTPVFERAEVEEPASVRARIRHGFKAAEWYHPA